MTIGLNQSHKLKLQCSQAKTQHEMSNCNENLGDK